MGPAHEKTMAPSSKKERAYTNPLLTESKQGNRGATAILLAASGSYPPVARIHVVASRACGWRHGGVGRVCGAAALWLVPWQLAPQLGRRVNVSPNWWKFQLWSGNMLRFRSAQTTVLSSNCLTSGRCQRDQSLCIAFSYVYPEAFNLFFAQ